MNKTGREVELIRFQFWPHIYQKRYRSSSGYSEVIKQKTHDETQRQYSIFRSCIDRLRLHIWRMSSMNASAPSKSSTHPAHVSTRVEPALPVVEFTGLS